MPDIKGSLQKDGELTILQWAVDDGFYSGIGESGSYQELTVLADKRPVRMAHSNATGEPLLSNGSLGADIIRLAAGDGFVPHTHPGDHLLIVLAGQGTITYDGKIYPTRAGQIYMVEGAIPHAVGAITDHVILAVGSPHMPVGSPERMVPVEYQSVLTDIGELHCLICQVRAYYPTRLHDNGCPHCPCAQCNPVRQ